MNSASIRNLAGAYRGMLAAKKMMGGTMFSRFHQNSLQNFIRSLPISSCTHTSLFRLGVLTEVSTSDPVTPSAASSELPYNPLLYTMKRYSHGRSFNHESREGTEFNRPPQLFVVQPRLRPENLLQMKLEEALNLANSLEEQRDGYFDTDFCEKASPPHLVVQNPAAKSAKAHADTFFGQGTVETVRCHLDAAQSMNRVDAVFVNGVLSAVQQRNLERAWEKPVLDRIGLIIEIFNAHAYTREAKLQAELAALMYKKSRLVRLRGFDGRCTFGASGEAEVVSARGKGSGGCGFLSGAGETELQLQRRRILERQSRLLSQIAEVRRTRMLQRAARKRHGGLDNQGLSTVAVVGYTNAGKSTLVGALSDTNLLCDDRLFATVDPRLRGVVLPSRRKVLLSDTVGFISDLPVQLVEAFHATLEEVVEADLVVHVIDSSSHNCREQRAAVLEVLEKLGLTEDKMRNAIEVWNKIDVERADTCNYCEDDIPGRADETRDQNVGGVDSGTIDRSERSHSGCVVKTSALTGTGLRELLKLIDEKLGSGKSPEIDVFNRKWRPSCKIDGVAVS